MKTLKISSTILLTVFSLNAFADINPSWKTSLSKTSPIVINQPNMEWGDPTDINEQNTEKLKSLHYLLIEEPAMNWGQAEELDLKSIENLKNAPLIPLPAMEWGEPSDAESFGI